MLNSDALPLADGVTGAPATYTRDLLEGAGRCQGRTLILTHQYTSLGNTRPPSLIQDALS
jgi:hypothetical protein